MANGTGDKGFDARTMMDSMVEALDLIPLVPIPANEQLREAQDTRKAEGSPRVSVPVSQAGAKAYEQSRAFTTAQSVKSPPPPRAFQGLQTGPELDIQYVPAQALPMSQEQRILRTLSPFMLQIEPPLVYASDASFTAPNKKTSTNLGIYNAAQGSNSGYDAARSRLAQSGINNFATNAASGEEAVVKNANSPRKNATSKGDRADNTGKDASRLGQPAIADVMTALDIAWQLSVSINTPPLVLLINPSSLNLNITKIQQYQDRSRFGYIFHSWGEDQPRLSVTAKCGAFMAGGMGVQFASKNDSAAWQNLMNLFTLYRNNGYIYNTVDKSNAHHFVGALSIHYDQWVYYGHIESFNYSYDEGLPNGAMDFTLEFVVSMMQDTSQQTTVVMPMKSPIPSLSDPRYAGMINRARNRPGNFSVGFNDDGTIRLTTQGREIGASDTFQVLLPQEAARIAFNDPDFQTPSATQIGARRQAPVTEQPVGTSGFQPPPPTPEPGGRPVDEVEAVRVSPFKVAQGLSG